MNRDSSAMPTAAPGEPHAEPPRSALRRKTGPTGPTSQEGKHRASLNASKHGLTSSSKTLKRSHPELFHEFATRFAQDFAPQSPEQETQFELLITSYLKMRLHQHTEAAAIEQDRQKLRESWDFERAQEAQERLRTLDELSFVSGRLLRSLLVSYPTTVALCDRFQKHAEQLAETRVLERSTILELRKYTGYSRMSTREEELPETLRAAFLDLVDPKTGASLDDQWLGELLQWIHAQQAGFEALLPELEEREQAMLRDALLILEIPQDTPASRLRYRYGQSAERSYFKALALLEPCRVQHVHPRPPHSLAHLLAPPPSAEVAPVPVPASEAETPTAPTVDRSPSSQAEEITQGGGARVDSGHQFVSSGAIAAPHLPSRTTSSARPITPQTTPPASSHATVERGAPRLEPSRRAHGQP